MKTCIRVIIILILVFSCQENKKKETELNAQFKKGKTVEKKKASKNQNSGEMPTEAQFEAFFPKQLDIYNLINVSVSRTLGVGSGTYIRGKDYGNIMTYIVTDGYSKGSAAIRNFEDSFQSIREWPEGTELIAKERDGFKTVALLRHPQNNYKISALYKDRFVLTVEGHEMPDALWTYLKKADLELLNPH